MVVFPHESLEDPVFSSSSWDIYGNHHRWLDGGYEWENLDLDLGDFHKWICKYGEISLRIWVITENLDWMENM